MYFATANNVGSFRFIPIICKLKGILLRDSFIGIDTAGIPKTIMHSWVACLILMVLNGNNHTVPKSLLTVKIQILTIFFDSAGKPQNVGSSKTKEFGF